MRWWKVIGLAGLAGVAATGVAVTRAERRRQAYTPDEIRARLHTRLAEAGPPSAADWAPTLRSAAPGAAGPGPAARVRRWSAPAVRRVLGVLTRLRRSGGAGARTRPDVLPADRPDA